MEDFQLLIFLAIVLVCLIIAVRLVKKVTIFEYERGVLFDRGKFKAVLEPGEHWLLSSFQTLQRIDIRQRHVTIPGQEVLTADNVSLKVSLVLGYRVSDPHKAVSSVASFMESFYLEMQLVLRDLIGQYNVDDLLSNRRELSNRLLDDGKSRAASLGLDLLSAGIRDLMFPGELKSIFAQVLNARKEGLAALERARGEQAALRNLANAAQLLENNPALLKLRILQALDASSGNTIVLEMGASQASGAAND